MSTLVDGLLDPERAARVLRSANEVELRLAPVAGEDGAAGYGPAPVEPLTFRLRRGDRAATAKGATTQEPVGEITLETAKLTWGGWGGAPFEKVLVTLVVCVGDRRLIAAQAIAADEDRARAACADVETALEDFLGGAEVSAGAAAPAALSSAAERFAFVLEGDYLVLRDYQAAGPREGIAKYALLSVACLVLSGLAWSAFARELSGAHVLSSLLGLAALGLVLALAALAMGEIARFASKYRGKGAPLAWFHDDRIVVSPWVSREGAIGKEPMGQLGAAVRITEVDDVSLKEHDGTFIIWLDTQHGPIDVVTMPDRELAVLHQEAILRWLRAVAAPAKRPRGILRAAPSAA